MIGELAARAAGKTVYRNHKGQQAWCLCAECTARHQSRNKRRTRHDTWAIDGQDWRIHEDLARKAPEN
ncbi:hypothetical protein [Mycolicibacter longobardus]|uniref:Uncharacterized protein n=1 Tax=Mycolicibacter longobardus TaxID=1108812 RepID=A0A1X1YAK6_9MYCO|nr:hypothetical protein [Mycolicibacter longobardus]ORW08040.1 hypothetical protein AWC16_20090 [Mycolicibacter longobardus]RAV04310.1 hypothetical protein DQP56_00380 [Mycolicibacter senuensis]